MARRPPAAVRAGLAVRPRTRQQFSVVAYQARWTLGCPCCEPLARETLEVALRALPPRSRAALRDLIRPLDDEIRRRTLPDPTSPPEWPWWKRRISGIHRD